MTRWETTKQQRKVAEATAVPFPDSSVDSASSSPLPGLSVGNKPAPGQTGPKGLAPRTNYSRVNTGNPIVPDAGLSAQKGSSVDPQGFLPPKIAHSEASMTEAAVPSFTLNQLLKSAMAGTQSRVQASAEAARQLSMPSAPVKTAAAAQVATEEAAPSTAYVEKFASAIEHILETYDIGGEQAVKEATVGEGPNHLAVSTPQGGKNPIAPGAQGAASPSHQVPKSTGLVNPGNQPAGPATALETSKPVSGKQKVSAANPVVAELRKRASAGAPTAASAGPSVNPNLVDALLGAVKTAEDAINPAKISAGAAVPPETSASGEAGGAPAGGQPQGPTGLIGSNDAARNYTKGEAKSQVKGQLSKVLTEPALSAAHDNVLQKTLSHTGQAGVKISSAARTAAARAALEKMAAEDDDKKKKKESTGGMGAFSAPPVGGVAGASQ